MRGAFHTRTPVKTFPPAWSVGPVLELLRSWSPMEALSLKLLSLKTIMLLALVTGRRCSSLALLSTKRGFCEFSDSRVRLVPRGLEKTTRPEHLAQVITLEVYLEDVRIDPVAHLRHYVTRTAELRDSEAMFVTMVRPHGPASKATLASWIQQVLAHSGQRGTGGSTRSTAASHAAHRGARLEDVLLAADWASASTFRSFYLQEEPDSFQQVVLNNDN